MHDGGIGHWGIGPERQAEIIGQDFAHVRLKGGRIDKNGGKIVQLMTQNTTYEITTFAAVLQVGCEYKDGKLLNTSYSGMPTACGEYSPIPNVLSNSIYY